MSNDYEATRYTDTHRCARCGHEWEDDGGYYYGCPRCAATLDRGMSWDAMTPEEQERVKGQPARYQRDRQEDLAGREYVVSRATFGCLGPPPPTDIAAFLASVRSGIPPAPCPSEPE